MDQKSRLDELREEMKRRSERLKEKISVKRTDEIDDRLTKLRSELSVSHPTRREVQSPSRDQNQQIPHGEPCQNANCGYLFGNKEKRKFCPQCGTKVVNNNDASLRTRDAANNAENDYQGDDIEVNFDSGNSTIEQKVKRALFIGNSAYEASQELPMCVNDAREMQKLFSDLGYQVKMYYDLDLSRMRIAFDQFKEDIEFGDETVIFFSGHGLQVNSELYLVPSDDSQHEFQDFINIHKEMDEVTARGARMVMSIVDACRNQIRVNIEGSNSSSKRLSGDTAVQKSGQRKIGGRALVLATSHNTTSAEYSPLGHGIFTYFFLKEAKVKGKTIREVMSAVRESVLEFTHHNQNPSFHDELNGDFYFTK